MIAHHLADPNPPVTAHLAVAELCGYNWDPLERPFWGRHRMVRRLPLALVVGSLMTPTFGVIASYPAGAAKSDCSSPTSPTDLNACVWDQHEFNGKMTRVRKPGGGCTEGPIRSAANNEKNGAIYLYPQPACMGYPMRVSAGDAGDYVEAKSADFKA